MKHKSKTFIVQQLFIYRKYFILQKRLLLQTTLSTKLLLYQFVDKRRYLLSPKFVVIENSQFFFHPTFSNTVFHILTISRVAISSDRNCIFYWPWNWKSWKITSASQFSTKLSLSCSCSRMKMNWRKEEIQLFWNSKFNLNTCCICFTTLIVQSISDFQPFICNKISLE